MIQGFPEVSKYKVMVQCCTFNQSQYIEDTLKGFAMQQTNFAFVCCVFDDASTDGEPEVLKHWIENHCNPEDVKVYNHPLSVILMAPDKDNSDCIYAIHLQKVNTWGKPEKLEMMAYWEEQCEYVAICEGDDYWIDPLKLQKQVDIMEGNQSIGVCYTRAKIFYQDTGSYANEIGGEKFVGFKSQLLKETIMTLTSIYRVDLYAKYLQEVQPHKKRWLMGDTPLWLWFSLHSQIYFIEDITSVYRVLTNSGSHSGDYKKQYKYHKSLLDIRLFFVDNYCADDVLIKRKIYNDFHRRNMRYALKTRNFSEYYKEFRCLTDKTIKDLLRPLFYYKY